LRAVTPGITDFAVAAARQQYGHEGEDSLEVIPKTRIRHDHGAQMSRGRARPACTGARSSSAISDGQVPVTSGLALADRIVVKGALLIDNAIQLQ